MGLTKADLSVYMPIEPQVIDEKNIQVHYLGYYLPWHPQSAYYYAAEHGGFKVAPERDSQAPTASTTVLTTR